MLRAAQRKFVNILLFFSGSDLKNKIQNNSLKISSNPKRVLFLIYLQIQNQKIIKEGEKFRRNVDDSPDFEYQLQNVRITGENDDPSQEILQVIEKKEMKTEELDQKNNRSNDVQIVKVNKGFIE